jgi:NACalpha-BTF3-like transcription factor
LIISKLEIRNPDRRWRVKFPALAGALLLALAALGVVGCAHVDNMARRIGKYTGIIKTAQLQIIPLSNQQVVSLKADDIVLIMRQAGFSDEQILQLGTDLRNALLLSGAAQVKLRDKVEAIFAVHDNYVFITTRLRGSFIYDVTSGTFGLRKAASES